MFTTNGTTYNIAQHCIFRYVSSHYLNKNYTSLADCFLPFKPIAFYPLSYTTRPSSMITLLRESSNDETLKEFKHFMPTYNNDSEIYESAMRSHNEVAINESTDMIIATGYG